MATARRHLGTMASLATPFALPVERLEGFLHRSNEPVAMVFAGAAPTADFVASSLFAIERRTAIGRLSTPLELRGTAFGSQCANAQLLAAEVPPLWRFSLPANMQLRMPAWVSQQIGGDEGFPIELPAELLKEVMRHSRREGYEVELSTEAADIGRFYADLYRPYVKARFGDGAVLVDQDRFLDVSRGMTLAMLRANREWVAGMLFRQRGKALHLGWFGSPTVPPRAGASEVLDVRVIERAAALGVQRVVMGHSRPSLADGVLRYKSRFGATVRPTRFPQRIVGLQILKSSPALVASVNAARFLRFHRGQAEAYETSALAQDS